MFKNLVATCFISAFCLEASAQQLLNQGESVTFYFPAFPAPSIVPQFEPVPWNTLHVQINAGSFGVGDSVLLEMFEGQATGSPMAQMTLAPGGIPLLQTPTGWNDLEGSVRITTLTGSVLLEQANIGKKVNDPLNPRTLVYSISFTPVPEPGCLTLASSGLVWLGLGILRKKGHITGL
jgi:hypothetical protein